MSKRIKVFLCDDHTLFRQGLRKLLDLEKDVVVVGEAVAVFDARCGEATTGSCDGCVRLCQCRAGVGLHAAGTLGENEAIHLNFLFKIKLCL